MLGLVDVPVVETRQSEHRACEFDRERLLTPKAIGCAMAHRGRWTLRAARGFGDGGLHPRIIGGLGGGESLLQKGDVGINRGEAV